jgi:hypothetical protein
MQEAQTYEPYGRTGCYFGGVVPIVASTKAYVDDRLVVRVERIPSLSGSNSPDEKTMRREFPRGLGERAGKVVATRAIPLSDLYSRVLHGMVQGRDQLPPDYWTVSSVRYGGLHGAPLEPHVDAPDQNLEWSDLEEFDSGYFPALPDNKDVQLRQVVIHNSVTRTVTWEATCNIQRAYADLNVHGLFDPEKLPGFSALSRVPLESYYPPVAEPADAASRRTLDGRPLMPTLNLGGYVQQPPFMFTTLPAAQALLSSKFYDGGNAEAPISAIRVRVAGVTGPDPVSLGRIRTVAQLIQQRTGLQVDITAGSSPTSVLGFPQASSGSLHCCFVKVGRRRE